MTTTMTRLTHRVALQPGLHDWAPPGTNSSEKNQNYCLSSLSLGNLSMCLVLCNIILHDMSIFVTHLYIVYTVI